jgi:hypothetical protein
LPCEALACEALACVDAPALDTDIAAPTPTTSSAEVRRSINRFMN